MNPTSGSIRRLIDIGSFRNQKFDNFQMTLLSNRPDQYKSTMLFWKTEKKIKHTAEAK